MADDYALYHAQNMLKDIEGKITDVQNAVNDFLNGLPWWVPDFVVKPVYDEWNNLCGEWKSMIEAFADLLDNLGAPWQLRAQGNVWRDSVEAAVTSQPGHVAAGVLLSDDFSGSAASSYKSIIPGQTAAMTACNTQFVQKVVDGLDTTANAINKCVSTLEKALVDLGVAVAGVIIAIAAAETVIGLVAGLVVFVGAAAKCIVDELNAKDQLETDTKNVYDTWNGALKDWTNFDEQKWPQAVFAG